MTEEQLKQLIKQGEGQTLEFKTSTGLKKEICQAVSAFSNTAGGTILVGVSPRGEVLGVNIGKETVEDLANWIKRNTDPPIYPQLYIHKIDGKEIIEILVKEAEEKPVFYDGHAFQRAGRTSPRVSVAKIREMARQERTKLSWDERICEEADFERDIDGNKVKWFIEKARQERKLNIDSNTPDREILERLEFTKNGRLTNAAVLLFGKNPQRFFLMTETRCGRFKGTEPTKPFIDMKVFGGSIIDQVDQAVDFVLRNISMAAWVEGGKIERTEKWEYPPEAIREAIVNAICHRDYEMSSNVQVRVFDDRIEVWGCGPLPPPLTVKALKEKHMSVLRNLLIGKCFFLIKFIEQWGTGTNDIIKDCLAMGLPEPSFEEVSGGLVVTLRRELTEEFLRTKGLNEKQIKTVYYIRQKGSVSNKEYQDLFNVSRATATRDIRALVEKGILKHTGRGKRDSRYIIK